MRILAAEVSHFASYDHLKFQFDGLGLTLVSGQTGSGKSTLLDIVPWCLFGLTAKGGSVEDVRAWQASGEPTIGQLEVQLPDQTTITVVRIRGRPSENDLYWTESGSAHCNRGKDLVDTQKLLNARLALDSDTYLSASYFHEFSQTGSFFTAKAKDRRDLFEKVCDISFPDLLSARASDARRNDKSTADALRHIMERLNGRIEQLESSRDASRVSSKKWQTSQKEKIQGLQAKAEAFEADKAKLISTIESKISHWEKVKAERLESLTSKVQELESTVNSPEQLVAEEKEIRTSLRCQSCGSLPETANAALQVCVEKKYHNNSMLAQAKTLRLEISALEASGNPFSSQLETAWDSQNTYTGVVESEMAAVNPFEAQIAKAVTQHLDACTELGKVKTDLLARERRISALSRLLDLCGVLRGELLWKAVAGIETQTNRYLEKYFDAEIRVGFTLEGDDNLTVAIQKSGYDCNYRQLSRGQRALLRLTFAISVMKAAANASGVHLSLLCFDEVLDGCDTDLKVKAIGLFEELGVDHSTVMVIDHCTEVKSMFTKTFAVEMIGDTSQISEQ